MDFSFSGLKTAVLNEVKAEAQRASGGAELGDYSQISAGLSEQFKADLAASFQEAVVDVLTDKLIQGFLNLLEEGTKIREIHLAGGVSANSRLREMLTSKVNDLIKNKHILDVRLRFPQNLTYCTGNAAMIAGAAYFLRDRAEKAPHNVTPTTSFDLF